MREVSHPNLLQIHEIFEGDNNIYCVGKLYKGATLSSLIQDKKYKFEEKTIVNLAGKLLKVELTHPGSRVPRVEVYPAQRHQARECGVRQSVGIGRTSVGGPRIRHLQARLQAAVQSLRHAGSRSARGAPRSRVPHQRRCLQPRHNALHDGHQSQSLRAQQLRHPHPEQSFR